ncbi:dihydrofolate reductase family protein [Rhizobiales bacterium 3FA27D7]|uniref:dihydrofolate reductase family protein n=1 Tax=Mesorhizobium sp. 2RAF21 TaxID=3232995 RepID=UPI0010F88CC2
MRNVVLIMTMSIDGYVVGPEGMSTGGFPEPTELKRWKLDRIRQAGTHIMGRVSYKEMGPYWQKSDDAYAAPMNDIPKVVFSKTLKEASWPESSIASGDLHEEISKLKKQPGGEIVAWGGAQFAQALSKADLIDEYVILTRPIAYGGGKPLFSGLTEALKMNVLVTNVYDNGTMLRIYAPR